MTRPLIIAHRGLTPGAVENSRSAIPLAAGAGADMIELDIRLNLDRQPVVVHDWWLRRTTSRGRGWVDLIPSPLLTRMRLRGMNGEVERIPLLRTMLRAWPRGVELALHLKDRWALHPVLRLIRHTGDPARTWLWLERASDVHTATRALPEVRCTLLRPGARTDRARARYFSEAQFAGASAVSIPWSAVTEDVVRLAHQHSLLVFSLERVDHSFPTPVLAGLDGIITADPAATRERLDKMIAPS